MNISTGVDIIEIGRFKELIEKRGISFLRRAFTTEEIEYCESKVMKFQHYAARFAAKEAVMKALGCGWNQGVQWKHIEVLKDNFDKPYCKLHMKAKKIFDDLEFSNSSISLSHSENFTVCNAILF